MAKNRKRDEEAVVDAQMVEEAAAPEAAVELVDFETWFALRAAAIPGHHRKEILKADFTARKVPDEATMAEFDNALEKYGVKLA